MLTHSGDDCHDGCIRDNHHSFVAKAGLSAIKLYQKFLSPIFGNQCRFEPTCSRYTYGAIEKYGLIRGCLMGAWRICRCNPFSRGGKDPVP